MILKLPGVSAVANRRYVAWFAVVLIVLGAGSYWFYFRNHNKSTEMGQAQAGPAYQQYANAESKQADTAVSNKDYNNAETLYLLAARDARASQGPAAAASILQKAATNIPDSSSDWILYSSLAEDAGLVGNKSLEKQSLTKAIQKAEASNSGASADQVQGMKQSLSKL